jgi:hypothetical protein
MHRPGAHCLVVARKRGNSRGAKGAGHPRWDWVNGKPEEPFVSADGGSLLWGGTSRMNREVHVRICGRPGAKFPGPTRQFPGPTLPHICGTNWTTGHFALIRQTVSKRRAAKLKQIHAELRRRAHDPLGETAKWLQSVVRGYFQYHAIPGNEKSLGQFRNHVRRLWLRQIRRRSQRSRWTWVRFLERLGGLLPEVCVLHPYPDARFAATHPR